MIYGNIGRRADGKRINPDYFYCILNFIQSWKAPTGEASGM